MRPSARPKPGWAVPNLDVDDARALAQICYEHRFPVQFFEEKTLEYDVLRAQAGHANGLPTEQVNGTVYKRPNEGLSIDPFSLPDRDTLSIRAPKHLTALVDEGWLGTLLRRVHASWNFDRIGSGWVDYVRAVLIEPGPAALEAIYILAGSTAFDPVLAQTKRPIGGGYATGFPIVLHPDLDELE